MCCRSKSVKRVWGRGNLTFHSYSFPVFIPIDSIKSKITLFKHVNISLGNSADDDDFDTVIGDSVSTTATALVP